MTERRVDEERLDAATWLNLNRPVQERSPEWEPYIDKLEQRFCDVAQRLQVLEEALRESEQRERDLRRLLRRTWSEVGDIRLANEIDAVLAEVPVQEGER